MTLRELHEVLKSENVYIYDYSINSTPKAETVVCVDAEEGGFHVYIADRADRNCDHFLNTEHASCLWVLDKLSSSYPNLKKYIK